MPRYKKTSGSSGADKLKITIIVLLSIIIVMAIAFAVYYFFFGPGKPVEKIPETQAPSTKAATIETTEEPTESEYLEYAEDYLENMSEDEKICQLFITTPEVLTENKYGTVTAAGDVTKEALENYPVGGLIYFKDNFESYDQAKEMLETTQSYSKTPLLLSVDEEGGDNSSVNNAFHIHDVNNMSTYKNSGPETALENAKAIASPLKKLGFNLDFAPVTDVNSSNNFMSERAYSDDYSEVSTLISSAIDGFHQRNMICTSKHFPGLGNATGNPDKELVTINKSEEQLRKQELLPFKSAINAGADMIMVSHGIYPVFDKTTPASLSSKIVPTLLRKDLNYKGITITESLSLKSITDNFTVEEIVSGALVNADLDILLMPSNISEYIEAIKDSSVITDELIDAKVLKILELKFKYGLLSPQDINKATTPTEADDNDEEEQEEQKEQEETIPFHNEGGGGGENPEE